MPVYLSDIYNPSCVPAFDTTPPRQPACKPQARTVAPAREFGPRSRVLFNGVPFCWDGYSPDRRFIVLFRWYQDGLGRMQREEVGVFPHTTLTEA